MSRNNLVLAAVLVVIAAAAAAAVIAIELGLAFQSQSDSTDDIPVGDFVKARDSEGKMVSISPVVYVESQDKESYVLTNTSQSVRGTMQVGTKENAEKNLTSMINFQETGTWMLVETMDLVLQRETCFTVVVSTATTTLEATTVITIDEDGNVQKGYNDRAITGSWKVWGVGTPVVDYNPTEHQGDAHNGFIVLVDYRYILTHHYNVFLITGNNGDTKVELRTPGSLGDVVISGNEWKVWNSGNPGSGYTLKSTDLYRCTDQAANIPVYNSMTSDGVAGKMTAPTPVYTGFYDFTINIQYKSTIKNNPGNYDGENMRSTIVFFLSNIYSVTYVNTNGPSIAVDKTYYHAAFTSAAMNPSAHYNRAATVTVTMSGEPFNEFSYNSSTGVVTIAAGKVAGNLVITAVHTPEQYTVTYNITNGSATGPATIGYHTAFTATIAPTETYVLPDSITVTMGGNTFTGFTYNQETGAVTIATDLIEGNLVITAVNTPSSRP